MSRLPGIKPKLLTMAFSDLQDPGLLPLSSASSLPIRRSPPRSKLEPGKSFLQFPWDALCMLLPLPGASISFLPDSSLFGQWFRCHILSEAFPERPGWLWPALSLHTCSVLYFAHPSPLTLLWSLACEFLEFNGAAWCSDQEHGPWYQSFTASFTAS